MSKILFSPTGAGVQPLPL